MEQDHSRAWPETLSETSSLVSKEAADCLEALLAPVDIVSQEEVVRLGKSKGSLLLSLEHSPLPASGGKPPHSKSFSKSEYLPWSGQRKLTVQH